MEKIVKDIGLLIKKLDLMNSGLLDLEYYFKVMRGNLKILEEVCK